MCTGERQQGQWLRKVGFASGVFFVSLVSQAQDARGDAFESIKKTEWRYCSSQFTDAKGGPLPPHKTHHKTIDEWQLDKIRFRIAREMFGDEEFKFDVVRSVFNKMQRPTLFLINPAAQLGVSKLTGELPCQDRGPSKKAPPLPTNWWQHPYLVGLTNLENEPNSNGGPVPATPHVLVFVPFEVELTSGTRKRWWHLWVFHIPTTYATEPHSGHPVPSSQNSSQPELWPSLTKGDDPVEIKMHNGVIHGPG